MGNKNEISKILNDLENDTDFVKCQKLIDFFRGEVIQGPISESSGNLEFIPFKHRVLDTEDHFKSILFRETGIKSSCSYEAISPIKLRLIDWLESLDRVKDKGMISDEITIEYYERTNRFVNFLNDIENFDLSKKELSLKDLFVEKYRDENEYNKIIELLRESKVIDNQNVWIDGDRAKAIRQIKYILGYKGIKFKNPEIKEILMNTFSLGVSQSWVSKGENKALNSYKLKFN